MLEGLDKIDWKQLTHAYGSAADVPGQIRSLASSIKLRRDAAMDKLRGNIWHQGSVYSATASAVPFLIELLEAESVRDKHEILALLQAVANGHSYMDVHQHLPLYQKLFAEEVATPKWKAELQTELSWVQQAHEAVRKGTPVYLRLLADGEASVRDAAAFVLGMLGGTAPGVKEEIHRRLTMESNEMVKASLLLALGRICEAEHSGEPVFAALLEHSEPKAVQLAAAMSMVRLTPQRVPLNAVNVLLDAIKSPPQYAAIEKSQWADCHSVVSYVSRFLCGVQPEAAAAAEQSLVAALKEGNHGQARAVGEALMSLAFGEPVDRGAKFVSLDERRQREQNEIANAKSFWGVQSGKDFIEDVDSMGLMRCYNLPDRQQTLAAFIRGEDPKSVAPPTAVKSGGMVATIKRLLK